MKGRRDVDVAQHHRAVWAQAQKKKPGFKLKAKLHSVLPFICGLKPLKSRGGAFQQAGVERAPLPHGAVAQDGAVEAIRDALLRQGTERLLYHFSVGQGTERRIQPGRYTDALLV